MKIICAKNDLVKGVNTVLKAVPTRTTMKILECILVDATAGIIQLTGNDTEIGIETIVPGMIEERGAIALDAKVFSEIVRKLPDNNVTIETDENLQTRITCEKANFSIMGMPADEFTPLPMIPKNDPITLSQFSLKEVIRQTIFSIADNENNKLMTGELFDLNGNFLKVVSLDGHRISIRNIELLDSYEPRKVVVPGKTLSEVSKIIPGSFEEKVLLYITENHIIFEFDETTVVSRLIDGEYFKIEQMISGDYSTKIRINKRELLDCIDRASLMVNPGDKKPIIMDVTEGNMELHINSFIGSMDEDIAITKEGRDIKIGFNPKFFLDALRVIDEEEINIYMVNPKAPCFIKDNEETFLYMILPVNFNA